MKTHLKLLCFLLLIQTSLLSQSESDRTFIKKHTNITALKAISKKVRKHNLKYLRHFSNNSVKKTIINSQNEMGYLSGFDPEGNPVYDFEDNVNAAITSGIDKIWMGGSSGLDLSGETIQIGHWEAGGLALTTHQELAGRVTHAENVAVSSHATHTAGTMIGSGVDIDARGMATSATIVSYQSYNDKAEMADFAAGGGIISNHSYSRSNPKGDTPRYGVYSYHSEAWDELLYNAPYLTVCKSAGNNRNDTVNVGDNGYDLIYTIAAAKNLLTVGAVHDINVYYGPQSINQSSFTNWGPTDDWRVKPDLVANGVSLYSANHNHDTDYTSKSGTSMSTPTVAGAAALLQEHYHNENNVYMKSATVRALLLGTTDEAGDHDGPDF